MNIFVLDYRISLSAKYHCDKHVVKQILETCQLLCITMRVHNINYGYKVTHRNHPCRLWLDKSKENFNWLKKLGLELSKEYTYRYGKKHKTQSIIEGTYCPNQIPDEDLTDFVQAMPDQYKSTDAVIAYRNYYRNEKQRILIYTRREVPYWLTDIGRQK